MINNTQPRLATTIAGYSQASRTCERWHVSIRDNNKSRLLLFVLICCCVTMTCGSKFVTWHNKNLQSTIKELLTTRSKNLSPQMGYCDLDTDCDWEWNENQGFKKVNARAAASSSKFAPITDANNFTNGTKTLSCLYFFLV